MSGREKTWKFLRKKAEIFRQMQRYESVYRASYWDYANPFGVETDPYESLVKTRMAQFGVRRRVSARRPKDFPKRTKKPVKKPEWAKPPQNEKKTERMKTLRTQMKKSQGQTFVSSDIKPLKKTPRVIVHLPRAPVSKVVTVDENLQESAAN